MPTRSFFSYINNNAQNQKTLNLRIGKLSATHQHMINYLQIAQDFFADEKWNYFQRDPSKEWLQSYEQGSSGKQFKLIQTKNGTQLRLGETSEGSFRGLTSEQILNIFADERLFCQVIKKKTYFPQQIDLFVWKLHYLIGEVIISVQNHLIKTNQLGDSITLQSKQIDQVVHKLIESVQDTRCRSQTVRIQSIKKLLRELYERGMEDNEKDMLQIYNYCISVCKPFLSFQLQIICRQRSDLQIGKSSKIELRERVEIVEKTAQAKVKSKGRIQNQPVFSKKEFARQTQKNFAKKTNSNLQSCVKNRQYLNEHNNDNKIMEEYSFEQATSFNTYVPTLNEQPITKHSNHSKTNREHVYNDGNSNFNLASNTDGKDNIDEPMLNSFRYEQDNQTSHDQKMNDEEQMLQISELTQNNYWQTDKMPNQQQKRYTLNNKQIVQPQRQSAVHFRANNINIAENSQKYKTPTIESRPKQTRIVSPKQYRGDYKNNQENSKNGPASNLVASFLKKGRQNNQKQTIELEDAMTIIGEQQPKPVPAQSNRHTSKAENPSLQKEAIQPSFRDNKNRNTSQESSKQRRKQFKQKWSSQQDSVLVKTYIEKGGLHQCVIALKQAYGDNQKYLPQHIKYRIDLIVHRVFMKFANLQTKNQNIIKFRQNKEFILRKSGLAPRRKMYQDILIIYSSMLNMSEEKRELISKKIIQINHICDTEHQSKAAIQK